jgi:hypothetical protein
MKTLPRTITVGICCIIFGILDIVIEVIDYQNRIYAYRYLSSQCKPGSSCPFPAMDDHIIWLGVAAIITGVFLISYKKLGKKGNENAAFSQNSINFEIEISPINQNKI